MASLRLLQALALAMLLCSRPACRLARAQDDDDFGAFGGGDLDGDDFPEGDEMGDLGDEGDYPDAEPESEIPEGDDGDVVALTADTLAEKVAEGKPFLLEFYAPWCGHCKQLAPEYKTAAAALKEYGVLLAKMDATKHESTAMEYGVEGYPSIFWVTGKTSKQFNGGRSSSDIISWVKKRVGFAVITVSTADEAKAALEQHAAIVAAYFKDPKGKEAAAFAESGKEADDVEYVLTSNVAAAKALGVPTTKPASIAVIKKQEDKFVAFDGEFTAEAITEFAVANRLPLFVTFSDDAAQIIFGGPVKKLVFLFFPDSEYAILTKSFAPIARENKGKVIFIYVNSTDEQMDNVREFFGVSTEEKLALGFSTENREDGEKFQMGKELTADNLKVFVTDFVSGTAKAFFKSEPIPETNDGPVTVVVGNNFEETVLDSTKDVLLEVYAPWCGHCKALEPTYQKLGEKFQGISSVVIAKMDGTANEHPNIKVEGFPTLLFYPADKKDSPVSVDADRKLAPLANFIKEHASIPFEAPEIKPEDEPEDEDLGAEDEEGLPEDEQLSEEELAEAAELERKEEL